MSHNTLEAYYKLIFAMAHHHHYQIGDLENLICYELDIYTDMVKDNTQKLAEQADRDRQAQEALAKRRF